MTDSTEAQEPQPTPEPDGPPGPETSATPSPGWYPDPNAGGANLNVTGGELDMNTDAGAGGANLAINLSLNATAPRNLAIQKRPAKQAAAPTITSGSWLPNPAREPMETP